MSVQGSTGFFCALPAGKPVGFRVSGFGFRVVQRARRVRLPGLLTTIVYPTLFAGTSGVREVINVDGFGLGNSGSEFRAGLVFWGYNPV